MDCTFRDTKDVISLYSKEEIQKADLLVEFTNDDFLFTYAGLRQVVDKYLVQDRSGVECMKLRSSCIL